MARTLTLANSAIIGAFEKCAHRDPLIPSGSLSSQLGRLHLAN